MGWQLYVIPIFIVLATVLIRYLSIRMATKVLFEFHLLKESITNISKYAAIAAHALLLYDIFLTLSDEVRISNALSLLQHEICTDT